MAFCSFPGFFDILRAAADAKDCMPMSSPSVILHCSSLGTLYRVALDKLGGRPNCGKCRSGLHYLFAPINAMAVTFDKEMSKWQELLFVELWSHTCGYCQMVEPVVRDIARWKAGKHKILKVSIQNDLPLPGALRPRQRPSSSSSGTAGSAPGSTAFRRKSSIWSLGWISTSDS